MSGRVFVVQNQHRWDREREQFVPKFDLTPAEEFGQLTYLLSPTAAPFNPAPVVEELHTKLEAFDDDDLLLLVGNPVLIGLSVAVAADMNDGRVRLLQWSGKDQRYLEIKVDGLFTFAD